MSEEILAGRNSVTEALRSGRSINKLLVQDGIKGGSVSEIIGLAKTAGVVLEFCKAERLDKLADGLRHQGFVALAAPIRFHSLEEVLALAKEKDETPFLLLLDELQDPQNVGALIRTADAAGVHGVLLPKRRSCPLNAVVAKISAGAVEYVPVVQIGNIPQTIEELKKLGFWIAGADMNGEDYYKSNLTGPMVIVVGAEGKGLGRLVKEKCDIIVSLPMQGGVSSLNASAAGAVLLYEVVRQRRVQAGYNVINSWQDFRKFREENLEHARELLKEKLAEYTAFKGYSGIVVFDAQEVQGVASFEKNGALEIVFTNEGETADSWIERRVYDLVKSGSSVFVVTSDYAEQLNVLGSGAYRISAREFREEYLLTKKQIAQRSERLARGLGRNELGGRLQEHILDHFEKLRRNT